MKRILFILLLSLCAHIYGEDKGSTIVLADGYASVVQGKSKDELRDEAFFQAKRAALEKVNTRVQSISRVDQHTLTNDLIITDSEGSIRVLDIHDMGIDKHGQYHIRIKAEVARDFSSNGAFDFSSNHPEPLAIRLWTSKKVYHAGEKIAIYFQGNKSYYVWLAYQTVSREWVQLLPSSQYKKNNFQSGEIIVFPSSNDSFQLEASPPYGEEKIILFAATKPFKEIPGFESHDIETCLDSLKYSFLIEEDGVEVFQTRMIIEIIE